MRPGHAAIFSVTQSSLDSVHVWEEGFSGVPNLSLSQQPLLVVTVSMHQNLGQHYAKVLCVGEKKFLRVIHLALELFTLQELTMCKLCQWVELKASGST